MNIDKDLLKYALQNAVQYNGKANPGSVIGKILAEKPDAKSRMAEISKEVAEAVKFVNQLSIDEQKYQLQNLAPELLEKKKKASVRELPELPNAEKGKVVMRMAPYPSGPLHIGNARTFIVNDEYVKRYEGRLLLVLDDTIGSEEKNISEDAYSLIPESLEWLGIVFDKNILFKSDRLEIYYEHAEKLINKEKAYVCFCPAEEMRENRVQRRECSCRNIPVKENLESWKAMLAKKYPEGKAILRLKTDMQHPNPAFRDRVLFRISEREHPRVGTKYTVWPLLEFSWAIDDHLLGITHILRGKDLMIESDMESFIWDILEWKKCEFLYTGLVAIEGVKISKSKSKKEVLSGAYSGWDDPRTWSLQSLRRRGFRPEAIRSFCLETGLAMTEITIPVESLYAENRKLIDDAANRYFFIENPVRIEIVNAPPSSAEIKLHPDHPERGSRKFNAEKEFFISEKDALEIREGDLVRLMDCINFVKTGKGLAFDSTGIAKYREHGKKIIHWLPASEQNIPSEIIMPDFTSKIGISEKDTGKLREGDMVQLVRTGFCRIDRRENGKIIFWYAHN